MATELLLMREGNALAAAEQTSFEAIQGMKHGEYVTATVRRSRNPRHHRKLFALLKVVLEGQDLFPTTDDLLRALKLATGLFDTGKTIEGITYTIPRSINFASMDQATFAEWYDKVINVILTRVLPNVNKADLEARVNDIINGER